MRTVIPIVEGHGEVNAAPELLRRLAAWASPNSYIHVGAAIRTVKSKFLQDEQEFSRKLQLAALKAGSEGWVLVILDADDDCPVALSRSVEQRAANYINPASISVVVANREYEAWFIAAANSLAGCRSFQPVGEMRLRNPDEPRDAKGWLSRQMKGGYHEVTDQPAFSAQMDLEEAWHVSRSFRRLVAEFTRHSMNLQ